MPKTVIISDVDEQNIANLRNKQPAHQVAKQYRISTTRVYDIWKRFNVYNNNLVSIIVDDLVKPSVDQIEGCRAIDNGDDQKVIVEQKNKIADLEDIIDDLNNIISDHKNKIAGLEDIIDNLNNIIADQQNKINNYDQIVVVYKNKISEQKNLIKNLKYEQKTSNDKISDLTKINHRLTLAAAQYYMTKK